MRRITAVATVCTVAGLALTGCKGAAAPRAGGSPTPTGTSSASPSADPGHTRQITRRLAAAVRALSRTSFQFDGGSGIARIDGSFDPVRRRGTVNGSFGIGAGKVLVLGSDLYVQGVVKQPDIWLHIDTRRLAPGNVLTQATDPTISTGYLDAISSARRTGHHRYQGTIDVARLAKDAAGSDRTARTLLRLLGTNPSDATFEASTDNAGRLTELSITVPESAESAGTTVTTRYHDFGTRVDVTRPPASQVREAPQQLYTVLAPTPGVSGSPTPSGSAIP